VIEWGKGTVLRANMPTTLSITRIADLNRGVYNAIVMLYKVRGKNTSLAGHTLTLTVKDRQWDDVPDDSSAVLEITGVIAENEDWRVVFPITAEQSYLDPTKEYYADIVDLSPDNVPRRLAILHFMVKAAPSNKYFNNTTTDGAAGSTVTVNEDCRNSICVNVMSGERGQTGERGMPGFAIEFNLSNQMDGVRTVFSIDPDIKSTMPVAVYYSGQRLIPDVDYRIDYERHQLTIIGNTLDAYEGRKLVIVVGSDTSLLINSILAGVNNTNGGGNNMPIVTDGVTLAGTGTTADPLRVVKVAGGAI
jgi:hypothetical protein